MKRLIGLMLCLVLIFSGKVFAGDWNIDLTKFGLGLGVAQSVDEDRARGCLEGHYLYDLKLDNGKVVKFGPVVCITSNAFNRDMKSLGIGVMFGFGAYDNDSYAFGYKDSIKTINIGFVIMKRKGMFVYSIGI